MHKRLGVPTSGRPVSGGADAIVSLSVLPDLPPSATTVRLHRMNPLLADVLQVLQLERLELDLFRGESRDPGHRRVFGGQVLGQALTAAYAHGREPRRCTRCTPTSCGPAIRIIRSSTRSIAAATARAFRSRRVVAIQHGEQIFHMSASFQVARGGDRPPGPDAATRRSRIAAGHGRRRRGVAAAGAGSAAAVSSRDAARSSSARRYCRDPMARSPGSRT